MLKEYLSTLANKFREILGETDKINAQDFAVKIDEVFNEGYSQGIPYGYNRGKEEGKLELLRDSEYMNAQVSGTAIAVNDVSPIEHNVGCYLTSDTITDFSGVEVKRYGKNLLNNDIYDFSNENWVTNHEDVSTKKRFYFPELVTGQTYTFSFEAFEILENNGYLRLYEINNEGVTTNLCNFMVGGNKINYTSKYFTVKEGCSYYLFGWFQWATSGMLVDNEFKTIGNFQLELGSTATAYEPYIEPTTYTAYSEGRVEGIKSLSPSMTLLTNNSGVVINANYLRDIDTYIDNLITDVALTGGE